MNFILLKNDFFSAKVVTKGAELQSCYQKQSKTEYIWQAHPAHWAKHSPILFPIVGTLKENYFLHNHKKFALPRHGFARDMDWEIVNVENETCTLQLVANENTLQYYPFQFVCSINYKIFQNQLLVTYQVQNTDSQEIYFSLGAHPAFNVPLYVNKKFEEYELVFDADDSLIRYKLTQDGLITNETTLIKLQKNTLPLAHDLFAEDAIVIKNFRSKSIKIKKKSMIHNGFTFSWRNFPHFGIWQSKNAPFLCLEPWQGFADNYNHSNILQEKEGIVTLSPKENWEASWGLSTLL